MLQNVWVARHGNRYDFVYPEWFLTALRRYDPSLSDDGIVQAKQLAARLKSEKITHIFSSPFLRSIQTANEVAEVLNLPIKLEQGLGEWLNPDWMSENPQLQPRDELTVTYPRIDWDYDSLIIPQYPESETVVINRVGETIFQLMNQHSEHILIVGHSITVMGAIIRLLGGDVEIKPSLCSLTKLTKINHQWQLELNCDISHLGGDERV
jgi:broad specificity phosphatase PhoE